MSKNNRYIPSYFSAIFSPKANAQPEEVLREKFICETGITPSITIQCPGFIGLLAVSPTTKVATNQHHQITLVLHGEVFGFSAQYPAQYLLDKFIESGEDIAPDLNGSFAILIIDQRKDTVLAITDRVNSKNVLFSKYQDNFYFSTSPDYHPTAKLTPDPFGVACYLANGTTHNNRTLFDGVRILERAAISYLTPSGLNEKVYWKYEFTESLAGIDEKSLRRQLTDLLFDSVKIRVYDDPIAYLSLSAGFDATTILGILKKLNLPDIRTITYAFGNPAPSSDAYIAAKTAEICGVNCRTMNSHRGDILYSIEKNAELGAGMTNFCDEIDVWTELADELATASPAAFFTGDACYALASGVQVHCHEDALRHAGIIDFGDLAWMKSLLPDGVFDVFHDGLKQEIAEIIARCPDIKDFHDSKDFFYLDQRLSNAVQPWRNYFQGRFITVRNALLDSRLLNFMQALPGHLRRDKILFRNTVTNLFPELFSMNRASTTGSITSWRSEFIAQHKQVEELIASHASRLDDLIPPQVILRLLRDIRSWKHSRYSPRILPTRFAFRFLKGTNLYNKILDRFPIVDLKTLLRRLLVMRQVLR